MAFTTRPLRTGDIERPLAAAGISDVTVPGEWEGTTLTAEGGPMVVAQYPDANVEVMQSPPFRNGFCFFWNTSDRIYIVAAAEMSEERAVALADSIH